MPGMSMCERHFWGETLQEPADHELQHGSLQSANGSYSVHGGHAWPVTVLSTQHACVSSRCAHGSPLYSGAVRVRVLKPQSQVNGVPDGSLQVPQSLQFPGTQLGVGYGVGYAVGYGVGNGVGTGGHEVAPVWESVHSVSPHRLHSVRFPVS